MLAPEQSSDSLGDNTASLQEASRAISGQISSQPLAAEQEIGYNSRGSLLLEQSAVFMASSLHAATTQAPAAECPASPATQNPIVALSEPIAAMSRRLKGTFFSPNQTGDDEGEASKDLEV
jgi:hypothetical protein